MTIGIDERKVAESAVAEAIIENGTKTICCISDILIYSVQFQCFLRHAGKNYVI